LQKTIAEYKKGKLNFSADEKGVVHMSIGKTDLDDEKLKENILEAIKAIAISFNSKEIAQIVKKMHLAPTMGPSVEFII
jgi:large subunit ribosomal protein L1